MHTLVWGGFLQPDGAGSLPGLRLSGDVPVGGWPSEGQSQGPRSRLSEEVLARSVDLRQEQLP